MRALALLWILVQFLASASSAGEAPDAAWTHLQGLRERANEKVPIGTNAVEFYSGREKALHDAAAEFVKQFPNDVHQAEAMLWRIQTTNYPDLAEQRVTLLRQNEKDAATLVDNGAWPANLRFQIQRTILAQWLDQPEVITTSGVAIEIEDRLADLVRKNPGETLISFQLARVDLMLRFEPEKGRSSLRRVNPSVRCKTGRRGEAPSAEGGDGRQTGKSSIHGRGRVPGRSSRLTRQDRPDRFLGYLVP